MIGHLVRRLLRLLSGHGGASPPPSAGESTPYDRPAAPVVSGKGSAPGPSRHPAPQASPAASQNEPGEPPPAIESEEWPAGVPVELEIGDSIDLHTFAPADTRLVVEGYLEEARERGFGEVRIIHGRGKGVRRRIVRSLLAHHPAVRVFRDAEPGRGGWGATVVILKPVEEGLRDPGGD